MKKKNTTHRSRSRHQGSERAVSVHRPVVGKEELLPIPGRRPVEELLQRGIQPVALHVAAEKRSRKADSLVSRCQAAGWAVLERERSELDTVAEGVPHQGYIAFIRTFPYIPFEAFVSTVAALPHPLLLALDQIQDAGNLGAVLRSAECAGVAGALLPIHRSVGVTSTVIKRSAGAALHLPICRVYNLAKALDRLSESGFRIYGADQDGSQLIYHADFSGPSIIVVGSESRGLRPGVKRRCHQLVAIPLQGRIASLNASAAAAVCLFEAVRQRLLEHRVSQLDPPS